MLFQQQYAKSSGISHTQGGTLVDFAPDLGRTPTYFQGKIAEPIRYREAMCALRDVVVSDLNYKAKDHSAYQAWVREQYIIDMAEVLAKKSQVGVRMQEVQAELRELEKRKDLRLRDFYQARNRYFKYLYEVDKTAWYVLDPVITVAPDEVFFEAFSRDESSYGRLAVHQELFQDVKQFAYGTTNIDFSDSLYNEMQRMRTYRPTEFQIDPSGFEVATEKREVYKEQKIDVPTSWIRGFLQVQSAMSMPTHSFSVQPIDIHNLCRFLRRNKERHSPRSLKFILEPGQPVQVVIQPWDEVLTFAGSVYHGEKRQEIRTWGRRRLFLLERLLPLARKVTIHLLGSGMPSFYVADLGHLSFTLGLSGWTRNDWASAANFDLMVGLTAESTPEQSQLVFAHLQEQKTLTEQQLSLLTDLPMHTIKAALRQLCSAGRIMFDLEIGKYRLRELTQEPLPMEQLQYTHPRQEKAEKLIQAGNIQLTQKSNQGGEITCQGTYAQKEKLASVQLQLDREGNLADASCDCFFYKQNRLLQGPCEHMVALITLYREEEKAWQKNNNS